MTVYLFTLNIILYCRMAFYITTIHHFSNQGVEKCHKSQLSGHYTGILWATLWKEVSATPLSHQFPGLDGERGHSTGVLLGPTVTAAGCKPVRISVSRDADPGRMGLVPMDAWSVVCSGPGTQESLS